MNVVYSSSDYYSEICGISLVSLFENNKNEENISVYIIDNDISSINKEKITEVVKKYNRSLFFENKINIESLSSTKIDAKRWNIGTFYRLLLPILLPKSIDRVIYLDCDTIIRHSLHDVYNTDLGNCIVAGCDDCRSNNYKKELGLTDNEKYINNGFLLINLKAWRDLDILKFFIEYIKKCHGDVTYVDQGVLNSVIGKRDLVLELPPKYNAQRIYFEFSYNELLKLRKPKHHCTEKEYDDAINDPVVVHFTPVFITGTRPWNVNDNHKFTPEYLHYKTMSPWKNNLPKNNIKRKTKIIAIIFRTMPRNLMIFIVSILHTYLYPWMRRMKK